MTSLRVSSRGARREVSSGGASGGTHDAGTLPTGLGAGCGNHARRDRGPGSECPAGALEGDGSPPKTLKAGDSSYVPAKHIHGGKNASTTEPVKVLVFRIHEKGQPITVGVTEPHFWK